MIRDVNGPAFPALIIPLFIADHRFDHNTCMKQYPLSVTVPLNNVFKFPHTTNVSYYFPPTSQAVNLAATLIEMLFTQRPKKSCTLRMKAAPLSHRLQKAPSHSYSCLIKEELFNVLMHTAVKG